MISLRCEPANDNGFAPVTVPSLLTGHEARAEPDPGATRPPASGSGRALSPREQSHVRMRPVTLLPPPDEDEPIPATQLVPWGAPRPFSDLRALSGYAWTLSREHDDTWTASCMNARGEEIRARGALPDDAAAALVAALEQTVSETPTLRPGVRAPTVDRGVVAEHARAQRSPGSRMQGDCSRGDRIFTFADFGISVSVALGIWMVASIVAAMVGGRL